MIKHQMNKDDKSSQSEKFIETARALGCDESEEAFAEKLKAITGVKKEGSPKTAPKFSS